VKRQNEADHVTVFLTTHYMDEAERVATGCGDRSRKIVAIGTADELKQRTNATSLEEAFLALTGSTIRDESATSKDQLRQVAQMFRGEAADERDLYFVAA